MLWNQKVRLSLEARNGAERQRCRHCRLSHWLPETIDISVAGAKLLTSVGLSKSGFGGVASGERHVRSSFSESGFLERKDTIAHQAEMCYTTCVMPKGIIEVA